VTFIGISLKSVYAETSPVQREEFRKWLDHHNNGCYIFAQVSRTAYGSGAV